MLYQSYELVSLFLKNIHNTYCIVKTGEGYWKIHGFLRFYHDDDFKSELRVLLEEWYNLKLLKHSYEFMGEIIKRVTDKVIHYREDVRLCVAVVWN
jgi:hypothetical protein